MPVGLGWYEFTFRMDEGPESYVNRRSERGNDKSGGERGVESIFLLERRIYVGQSMWCNIYGAIYMWCNIYGAICMVQYVWRNICGAIYVVQSILRKRRG